MKAIAIIAMMIGVLGAQDSPEAEGLLEATASKHFNYGLVFVPVKSGFAFDTQFYWTPDAGSQVLLGGAYVWKPKKLGGLKLIPGIYYVTEGCEHEARPAGCHDVALGLGWEWRNVRWGSRGFVAQTLRKTERRFGFADPVQAYRRLFDGKVEFGFAYTGESAEHHLFGKGGLSVRRYFGQEKEEGIGRNYVEFTFLTGHKGPSYRTTLGRSF
jgi:hypothetical protein